jgi:hypothetical protein
MFSPAPVYPAMEIARMTGALQLDLAELGPDDPFVEDRAERQDAEQKPRRHW